MATAVAQFNRLRQISQTFLRHGLGSLVDQLGLADSALARRPLPAERTAARFGRRLGMALNDLGPTFVKLGQALANRTDLFPDSVLRELKRLQDNSKPISARAARRVVEQELGAAVGKLFAQFDSKPLATGSIAQVHRARTWDSREIVVKVRRPGIERIVASDLALLESLARMVAARVPEIGRFDPVGFIGEFGDTLRGELDFGKEAHLLAKMRARLAASATLPAVVPELSTKAVLSLEFIDGVKITELTGVAARKEAAQQLIACFANQYLRGPLFHADPHPGNLLRRGDGSLVLLDLGAVGVVDARMRGALVRLAAAAARRDGGRMADALLPLVHSPATLQRATYQREMGALLTQLVTRVLGEAKLAPLLSSAFSIARKHGLRLRCEYFTLLRSCMLIDGVLRTLDPGIDPVRATKQHVLTSWTSRQWFGPALWLLFAGLQTRLARLVARPTAPATALALGAVLVIGFSLLRCVHGPV